MSELLVIASTALLGYLYVATPGRRWWKLCLLAYICPALGAYLASRVQPPRLFCEVVAIAFVAITTRLLWGTGYVPVVDEDELEPDSISHGIRCDDQAAEIVNLRERAASHGDPFEASHAIGARGARYRTE